MRPLQICVTRERKQAASLLQKIYARGWKAFHFPAIRISATENWQACDTAIEQMASYDWIIFASVNAFVFFYERMRAKGGSFVNQKIAAVGKKTAARLLDYNINPEIIPQEFNAKGLLAALSDNDVKGSRFLIPGSQIAMDTLKNGLRSKGGVVDPVEVYSNTANTGADVDSLKKALGNGELDCLTFFSPSAYRYFREIVGEVTWLQITESRLPIAAIGPTTRDAIEQEGAEVAVVPEISSEDELLKAVEIFFETKTNLEYRQNV